MSSLTALQQELLKIVAGSDTELSRSDIARALGRNRLNPHDLNTLDTLHVLGLIEISRVTVGAVQKEYRYRGV